MARLHERSAGKDVIRGKSTSLHGKSEEHGGSPSERVSSSPSPSSSSAMRDYQVNMTVTDKANNRAETFKCSWSTLRVMRYFQDVLPSPAVQAQREEPVSLHASCDVGIFKWLLRWIDHKRPSLTAANVVSIALSSNFLRMHELTDEALLFLRDHLTEVLLSGVDMDCLPGELLGRLSAITPEHVVVNALMELHTSGEGDHANRTFLASMLRHHVSVRLLAKDAEAGAATASSARDDGEASHKAPPTIDHRHDAHPNTSADTSTGCGDSGFPESGLRWCKLCSCLYNVEEMHRSMRAHACAEPTCPGVTNNRMGPRGEVLTTHTPSTRAVLTQPLRSWSRLQVERWALQIIGASRYARCRYCTALVALIDTPAHRCDGMMAGGLSFTPAEEASDAAAKEIWALTRWYGYATQQMIYNAVGGLSPLRYAASSSSVAANQAGATGSILVADCNLRAGTNNSSGNNNNTNSSSRTRSRSRSRTFNTGVPRRHVGGGARPVTGPRSCFWSARPQQVMEVAPFSGAAPDGDVANFYEHDMMHEMEALLTASASVGAPLYRMRLAVHSHQHVTGQSVYEGFGLGSGSNPYNMSGGVGGGGGYGKESMMNGLTTMPKLWRSSSYESGMMASPTSPTAAPFATPSVTDSRLTGYGGQSARARGSKTTSTRRPLPLSTGVGRAKTSVTTSATRTAALSATGSRSTLLNK